MNFEELMKQLVEQRARVWHEYRQTLEEIEPAKATAEDRQKWDWMDEELSDLDKRIATLKRNLDGELAANEAREAAERLIRPQDDPTPADNADERALRWFRDPEARGGIEVSLAGLRGSFTNGEARVMEVGTGSGGTLVPVSFRQQLYQHLIQNTAIRQTNVTVLTTASGEEIHLPKTTAHPGSGTIVAEGAAIGTSDPTFGQGTLNAYKYAALYQVSTELLQDSAVDLLGYLAKAFGRAIANGQGADFVTGSGSSKPNGVITAAGSTYQVVGGTPAANGPTYENLVDTMHKVIPPYRVNSYWMFNDKTLAALRKIKDSNGRPLWQPGLAGFAQGAPNTLMDKPYVIDPNVPDIGVSATSIAFGDFSSYFIRDVAGVRIERSDDYAFNTDLVTFRVVSRADGDLLDLTGAISTYKGGTA